MGLTWHKEQQWQHDSHAHITPLSRLDPTSLIVNYPQLQLGRSDSDKGLQSELPSALATWCCRFCCCGLVWFLCKLFQKHSHARKHAPHSVAPKSFPKALQDAKKKSDACHREQKHIIIQIFIPPINHQSADIDCWVSMEAKLLQMCFTGSEETSDREQLFKPWLFLT